MGATYCSFGLSYWLENFAKPSWTFHPWFSPARTIATSSYRLDRLSPPYWPAASVGGVFDRSILLDIFYRANIDPSERYVLSVPGSTAARIHPADTGFGNLTIAGDWTVNELNAGCVEAAVTSGILAADAVARSVI